MYVSPTKEPEQMFATIDLRVLLSSVPLANVDVLLTLEPVEKQVAQTLVKICLNS